MLSIFTHSYSIIMVRRPVSCLQTSVSKSSTFRGWGGVCSWAFNDSLKAAALFLEAVLWWMAAAENQTKKKNHTDYDSIRRY